MENNKKNLPVLYTVPRWKMRISVPGKKRKLYYIPELDKYVDSTHVTYELISIHKTPQEHYDRWYLNVLVPSDRPRISDGRIARFRDYCFGYAKTQSEINNSLTFDEWELEWTKNRLEFSSRMSVIQLKRYEDPNERIKTGELTKKSLADPIIREKISKNTKEALSTEEAKKNLSNGQKKRNSDPIKKGKLIEAARKRGSSEKFRLSNRIGQLKRYEDPNERIKTGISVRKAYERLGKFNSGSCWKSSRVYSIWEDKEISLDSSYESVFFNKCTELKVESLLRESIRIPYFKPWNVTDIPNNYYPDFLLNNHYLIEIKPNYLLDDEVNIAKFNAADLYCRENGLEYVILTEDYLFNNGEPFYGSMPF